MHIASNVNVIPLIAFVTSFVGSLLAGMIVIRRDRRN